MDIKEFIKQAVVGISDAILEVNTEKRGTGLVICPNSAKGGNKNFVRDNNNTIVLDIDFNLCVEVTDKTNAGAGLQITIVKAGVNNDISNSTTSNIKFTLPVAFPESSYKIGQPNE